MLPEILKKRIRDIYNDNQLGYMEIQWIIKRCFFQGETFFEQKLQPQEPAHLSQQRKLNYTVDHPTVKVGKLYHFVSSSNHKVANQKIKVASQKYFSEY